MDQTFVPHFIKKTMFITWNVKRERKRDTDDWFSQYTSNKMQKKKKKRQKKERRKKKPTLSILILKKPLFLVGLLCYSSIGVGNRLGVFTDLHFKFVLVLFLCLFHLLHGLLLSFFFFFEKEFVAGFLFTASARFFVCSLNCWFFRFL